MIDLRDHQGFEVVTLLDFDDEDIRLALQKRLPIDWEPVYQKIHELTNLRDLASRPVLLDMIVKTLPQIQDASSDQSGHPVQNLCERAPEAALERETDYIPPQDRLFFMQELAWEMYTSQKLTIPFSEFPERVTEYFGLR